MRELVYVVNGLTIASYEKARSLQPTGALTTKLIEIEKKTEPVSAETIKKREQYFARKRRGVEK